MMTGNTTIRHSFSSAALGAVLFMQFVCVEAAADEAVAEAAAAASGGASDRLLEIVSVAVLCVVLLLLKWSDRGRRTPKPITSLLEWRSPKPVAKRRILDTGDFTLSKFKAMLEAERQQVAQNKELDQTKPTGPVSGPHTC